MVSRRATSFPTAEEMRAFLGVHVAPARAPEFRTDWSRPHAGVLVSRVVYRSVDGDDIPALLMQPRRLDHPAPAVVAFHQHNSEWHLGKSEVAGLAGDPLQAFGPTLAAAGAIVLAPDSICFEDRRRNATGITPRADDRDQHDNELTYRLINGDTLARKVVQDAVTAVSMLAGIAGVDAARIGALGHSYGGNTVLFLAAIDDRISFACASGAAGSYRGKVAANTGLERALVVPGIAHKFDIEALVARVEPRPLLLVAGEDDKYAADAAAVATSASRAYKAAGATGRVDCEIRAGGHALTPERHKLICGWMIRQMESIP